MMKTIKNALKKLKKFWSGLSGKIRFIISAAVSVLLVCAVALTVVLNIHSRQWTVLFPGMTSEESAEVYKELQGMNVETKINSSGEIEVRKTDWDDLVYRMAEKGFPQSTPSYGIFFDNLSMTMSEFEKKATLRFSLQDRIQNTLCRIDGVKAAIVTINVPESTNYVWKDNKEKATASVVLTLENLQEFGPDRVSAVKNIVAFSAQQVLPGDVSVVDAASGLELASPDSDNTDLADSKGRVNYSSLIEDKYEEKVLRILAPVYGEDNVTAVAYVQVDYDRVNEEVKELITNEKGEGSKTSEHIGYNTGTDAQNSVNTEQSGNSEGASVHEKDTEWALGYILTQTEKAQGGITDARISVVVPSATELIDESERSMIIGLVKNVTDIDEDKISVSARLITDVEKTEEPAVIIQEKEDNDYYPVMIIAGLAALVILVSLISAAAVRSSSRKKIAALKAENAASVAELRKIIEDELQRRSNENSGSERSSSAEMSAEEAKMFIRNNPEIAASLIRSLMKE